MIERLRRYLEAVRPVPFETAVCGHRGASAHAPENTVSAFRGALEAGCHLVELDVFLTGDMRPVVIHDSKLGRTADRKGYVHKLTLDEIRAADAGKWFLESFEGEKVPTLAEALAVIGPRAVPMIELKMSLKKRKELLEPIAEDLCAAGLDRRCVVIAWDVETADRVRERLPHALVTMIAFTRLGVRKVAAAKLDGVLCYHRSCTRRLIEVAHELDLFVAPWTVNTKKDMDFFCRAGADVIVTDLPHVLLDHLEHMELLGAREELLRTDLEGA